MDEERAKLEDDRRQLENDKALLDDSEDSAYGSRDRRRRDKGRRSGRDEEEEYRDEVTSLVTYPFHYFKTNLIINYDGRNIMTPKMKIGAIAGNEGIQDILKLEEPELLTSRMSSPRLRTEGARIERRIVAAGEAIATVAVALSRSSMTKTI